MTKLNQQFWEEQARKITDTSHLFKFKSKILDKKVIRKDHILKSVLDKEEEISYSIIFDKLNTYKGEFGYDYPDALLIDELTHIFIDKDNKFEQLEPLLSRNRLKNIRQDIVDNFFLDVYSYERGIKIHPYSDLKHYVIPILTILKGKSADLKMRMLRNDSGTGRDKPSFSTKARIKFICPKGVELEFKNIISVQNPTNAREYFIKSKDLEKTPTEITIKVNTTFEKEQYIEIYQIDEDKEQIVGKLQLFRNRIVKLPIRLIAVVYNYEDIVDEVERNNKIEEDYQKIVSELRGKFEHFKDKQEFTFEEFLNEHSFNQAAIQCDLEKTNSDLKVLKLLVSKSTLEEKLDLKDNTTPKEKLSKAFDLLFEAYKNASLDELGLGATDDGKNRKGVLILVTPFKNEHAGGAAMMNPVDNQKAIMFNDKRIGTYVHEIGHVVGLAHSFFETEEGSYQKILEEIDDTIEKTETRISLNKIEQLSLERKRIKTSAIRQRIEDIENEIERDKVLVENHRHHKRAITNSKYKFTQGRTDNYMDYYNERFRFYSWQWELMRREIDIYYN